MTYTPQPGYAPYHHPYQARPGTALAYVAAGLFLCCSALSLVFAVIGWDGSADKPEAMAALVGIVFSEDLTGNVDFAISATMTVACSVATFAIVLLFRVNVVRWILGVIGVIVTGYYVYALIYLLAHDAGSVVSLVVTALILWLATTVVALIPPTGKAMRGFQRRLGQPGPPMNPYGYR
jgi:hypothetical protein